MAFTAYYNLQVQDLVNHGLIEGVVFAGDHVILNEDMSEFIVFADGRPVLSCEVVGERRGKANLSPGGSLFTRDRIMAALRIQQAVFNLTLEELDKTSGKSTLDYMVTEIFA